MQRIAELRLDEPRRSRTFAEALWYWHDKDVRSCERQGTQRDRPQTLSDGGHDRRSNDDEVGTEAVGRSGQLHGGIAGGHEFIDLTPFVRRVGDCHSQPLDVALYCGM